MPSAASKRFRITAGLAARNVLRNRRSGFLTVSIIATGLAGVSLLDGFIRSAETELENSFIHRAMLGHVEVYHRDGLKRLADDPWKYALSEQDQAFIGAFSRDRTEIASRVRFLELAGMITNGGQTTLFRGVGYDVPEGARVRAPQWLWNAYAGLPLDRVESGPSVMLGKGLGRFLECEAQDNNDERRGLRCARPAAQLSVLTESGQVNATELPVTGLIDAGIREVDEHYVTLPLEAAQALMDTKRVTYISFLLRAEKDAPRFIADLNRAAATAGIPIEAFSWREDPSAKSMDQGIGILHVFKAIFLTVVACVGVMSVLNLMTKSISERIREIGTLRAIGFYGEELGRLFACEGFILAALGSALGTALAIAAGAALSMSGLSYRGGVLSAPLPVRISFAPMQWALDAAVFVLACSLTAMIAGRKASRLPPAEALSTAER